MRWIPLLALPLLPLVASAPAQAAEPQVQATTIDALTAQLKDRYKQVKTLEADVVQVVKGAMGESTMSGKVYLARPDKGRWELEGSGNETLMVFDGATGWIYTPGLNQVLKMSQSEGGNALDPLDLVNSLDERFDAKLVSPPGGPLHLVEAAPKAGTQLAAQYKQLRLEVAVDSLLPTRLVLTDSYGGTTEIRFSAPKVNADIAADRFVFTPPAGVEVVDGSL